MCVCYERKADVTFDNETHFPRGAFTDRCHCNGFFTLDEIPGCSLELMSPLCVNRMSVSLAKDGDELSGLSAFKSVAGAGQRPLIRSHPPNVGPFIKRPPTARGLIRFTTFKFAFPLKLPLRRNR